MPVSDPPLRETPIIINRISSLHSPLLELANYHVLGRILYYVPYLSPLPPGRILSTFGGLMGVAELLNSLGIALSSNRKTGRTQQELGSQLTIAALAIQLIVILIFVIIGIIFHRRCAKANIHARAVSAPLITLRKHVLNPNPLYLPPGRTPRQRDNPH
jgi:uncharacterized MAPEG superfamily protein